MNRLASIKIGSGLKLDSSRLGSAEIFPLADAVLILAFVVDLFAPFLTWKGVLPAAVTWLSHLALAAVLAIVYMRMMLIDRLPRGVLAILGISLIGVTVALFSGQLLLVTLWGWWQTFGFPLVGIYAYLRPGWSDRFPTLVTKTCLYVMGFQVVFQLGQYFTGQPIGDSLAGTFGYHGVGPLLFFSVFTVCLALGEWLAYGRWVPLVWAVGLGIISGVLAENKVFPLAVVMLGGLAVLLLLLRGERRWRWLPAALLLALGAVAFTLAFNEFVPLARKTSFEQYFLDEETRSAYLSHVRRSNTSYTQGYRIGRFGAVQYVLSTISGDPITLWFGFGLGARSESRDLGVTGAALGQDKFQRGSDLMAKVQEMGLFGLLVIAGFTVWVVAALYRDIRRYPESKAVALRYALLLFSICWLFWLWYKKPLTARLTMWLYWVALGYVLGEPWREPEAVVDVS